jgi:hypothetical protein
MSTPENWATTEFSSTIFTELLHTTELLSTTVFSYTPENSYTTEFTSTEYFFQKLNLTYSIVSYLILFYPNLTYCIVII